MAMKNPRSPSTFVGVVLIVFGAIPSYLTLTSPRPVSEQPLAVVLLFMVTPLVTGLALLWRGVGPTLAARRFGVPVMRLSPDHVGLGETLTARVKVTPPERVVVERVTFTLVAYDVTMVSTDDSPFQKREQASECFSNEREIAGATLAARESKTFKARFRIEKVLPSDGGRLRWAVRVHVAYAGYPDYHGEMAADVG
jgi:hypothetical protein